MLGKKVLLEEMSLSEIALCVEMAMPDDVPWRKAVAKKERTPVLLSSSGWGQTQKSLCRQALVI